MKLRKIKLSYIIQTEPMKKQNSSYFTKKNKIEECVSIAKLLLFN